MFASSFASRHCLVLADSFYEWKTLANGTKQPFRIMLKTGEPFAMAGIYARGSDHGLGEAESASITFAILTTPANELMQSIHERMPVILPLGYEKNWLPPSPSEIFIFATEWERRPKMALDPGLPRSRPRTRRSRMTFIRCGAHSR